MAAADLRRVVERDGWPCIEPATEPAVLHTALLEAGFAIESWSVVRGAWHRAPAADSLPFPDPWIAVGVQRRRAERTQEPLPIPTDDELARRIVQRRRAGLRRMDLYCTGDWLERRPIGVWLLFTAAHVFAAHAGRLIAGEEGGSVLTPLELAWRVVRR
jgi:hypothetical protein